LGDPNPHPQKTTFTLHAPLQTNPPPPSGKATLSLPWPSSDSPFFLFRSCNLLLPVPAASFHRTSPFRQSLRPFSPQVAMPFLSVFPLQRYRSQARYRLELPPLCRNRTFTLQVAGIPPLLAVVRRLTFAPFPSVPNRNTHVQVFFFFLLCLICRFSPAKETAYLRPLPRSIVPLHYAL